MTTLENEEASGSHADDQTITLELFNQAFTFRADAGIADAGRVVRKFESYVEQAQETVAFDASEKNKLVVLLLAGMNIASDLCTAEKDFLCFRQAMSDRADALLNKLNEMNEADSSALPSD